MTTNRPATQLSKKNLIRRARTQPTFGDMMEIITKHSLKMKIETFEGDEGHLVTRSSHETKWGELTIIETHDEIVTRLEYQIWDCIFDNFGYIQRFFWILDNMGYYAKADAAGASLDNHDIGSNLISDLKDLEWAIEASNALDDAIMDIPKLLKDDDGLMKALLNRRIKEADDKIEMIERNLVFMVEGTKEDFDSRDLV